MIDGHRITFVTFSDKRFEAWERLSKEAIHSGWFDKIVAGNETILENWYRKKYKDRFADHGYGWWQWKSYLIYRELNQLDDGDYVVYLDAGNSININGYKRLKDYLNLVDDDPSGVLLFRQGLPEVEWTKGDLFEYFDALENTHYTEHYQISASVIVVRKCWNAYKMISEWYYIAHNHYHLLSDDPSVTPNFNGYVEHRYDQSVLSMLSVKYHAIELSDTEIYTPDNDWETRMSDFPFWVTRLKRRKLSLIDSIKMFILKVIRR